MNYVQSNDDNSKEIVGVIDVVFSDVSQNESSSTEEHNMVDDWSSCSNHVN